MGIFDKLFGGKPKVAAPAKSTSELQAECPHIALMGRWDSAADMGKDDKVTAFICDACHTSFSPEEGRRLRVTTADRLNTEDIERLRLRAERAAGGDVAGR